ncbi:hypothetical protein FRC11_000335, partial [Ceratobasidium sp. 423]
DIYQSCPVYEVFALSAFLYLMIQYVANAAATTSIEIALIKKEKSRLPAPWCCFRYRPTKSSFMHTVKWLVLQFVIIRPIVTIISIILYAVGVLCPTDMSPTNPNLWLTIVDIFSMLTAMYGLLVFYKLTKQELKEQHALLKFAVIKGVIFITITQELVFKGLNTSGAIKPTASWSSIEVADGLNAFLLTIEMALASAVMSWAFSASEYSDPERPRGTTAQAVIDSVNFGKQSLANSSLVSLINKASPIGDFISEMKQSLSFFWHLRQNESRKGSPEPLMPRDYDENRVRRANGSRTSSPRMGAEPSSKNETRIAVAPV